MNLIEKGIEIVFGSKHERDLKRMAPIIDEVNRLEPELETLDDQALRGRFAAIRPSWSTIPPTS